MAACSWVLFLAQEASGLRLVARPDGVYLVAEVAPAAAARRSEGLVTEERWREADNGQAWVGTGAAVGFGGATVFAAKSRSNAACTLYSQGSSQPVFQVPVAGDRPPAVALAARAGRAATLVVVDQDPDPLREDYLATAALYDTAGSGQPMWSFAFPPSGASDGGGVLLNAAGNLLLAWKADANLQRLRVEARRGDGSLLAAGLLSTDDGLRTHFEARQVRLGESGRRAYFALGPFALIYDVHGGTVLHQQPVGGEFDAHAFSGDGRRFAFGNYAGLEVWEEVAPGSWQKIRSLAATAEHYPAWLALSADGRRLGFLEQRYQPAFDRIVAGMLEVDSGLVRFRAALEGPGTSSQLAASGCALDERGDFLAGACWGESLDRVPEGFVYDADGRLTCAYDARGSVLGLGFDPDGSVVCFAASAVHANFAAAGGDVIVCDAQDQELHLLGLSRLGGSLRLLQERTGTTATYYVADRLGSDPLSGLVSELDLSSLLRVLGPLPIPPGGLDQDVYIPHVVILSGNDVHVQGVVTGPSGPHLTNRSTLQLVP